MCTLMQVVAMCISRTLYIICLGAICKFHWGHAILALIMCHNVLCINAYMHMYQKIRFYSMLPKRDSSRPSNIEAQILILYVSV